MKKSIKDIFLIGLSAYAFLSVGYMLLVLSGISDEAVKTIALLFGKQLLFLLIYSIVLGASFLVFGIKLSPIAARLLHIAVTYAATVCVVLLLVSSAANAAQKLIYVVITTVLFAVVYGMSALFVYLFKKYKG